MQVGAYGTRVCCLKKNLNASLYKPSININIIINININIIQYPPNQGGGNSQNVSVGT